MEELLKAIKALLDGGKKPEEIATVLEGNPEALKVYNIIKGKGVSQKHNETAETIRGLKKEVADKTEEVNTLTEKVGELEKGNPAPGDDKEKKKLEGQLEKLTAKLEEMETKADQAELDSKWGEILKAVVGTEEDDFRVNNDYLDVLRSKYPDAVKRNKKGVIEFLNDGVPFVESDGVTASRKLVNFLRDKTPEGFRQVGSEGGGGGGGGKPAPDGADADFYNSLAKEGAADGKSKTENSVANLFDTGGQ